MTLPKFCKKGGYQAEYNGKKYKACDEHGIEMQNPLEYLGMICGQDLYIDLSGLNEEEKAAKKKLITDLLFNQFSHASEAPKTVGE